MCTWVRRIARFCQAEDGPTAVEYAVMLAFIITVCVVSITLLGGNTNAKFGDANLSTALGGS